MPVQCGTIRKATPNPEASCCSVLKTTIKVGSDQEKAQSEKDSHSKNRGGKKTKLTIRFLYHENISP